MPSVPYKATTPAPEDTAWSWDADTQNEVLGDPPDWDRYRSVHTWYEAGDKPTKGDFKLPHHCMIDGKVSVVWHGVAAAVARLSQADIPEADVGATFDHLAKHYPQWDKTPPERDRFMKQWRERVALFRGAPSMPLVETRVNITAARPHGVPTDDDLALINQQARTPLSADQVYVIPMEISNQNIDAYFTRMTPLTLANFADDSSSGVALCDSHNHYQMPIGRSFYGAVAPDSVGNLRTLALAYMVRGMLLPSGMRSDDYIAGVEAGIYQDDSVGFIPRAYWCSICGGNMMSFDGGCYHWPGMSYEIKDKGMVTCIADVDANLAEFSLVYDGATPNAMVLKAQSEMASGRATSRQLAFVEDHCRVKLFDRFPGFRETRKDDDDMRGSEFVAGIMTRASKEISAENLSRLQQIHQDLSSGHDTMDNAITAMAAFMAEKSSAKADDEPSTNSQRASTPKAAAGAKGKSSNTKAEDGADPPPDDEAGDGQADDEQGAYDDTGEDQDGIDEDDAHDPDEPNPPGTDDGDGDTDTPTKAKKSKREQVPVAALTGQQKRLIEIGRQAHAEAIEDALKSGARALGASFDETFYRKLLVRLSYDEVRQMGADWQGKARTALSPIGNFHPDARAQGGGHWDAEPTGTGGRQTQARDPNDPAGLVSHAAVRTDKGRGDPALYTTNNGSKPRR